MICNQLKLLDNSNQGLKNQLCPYNRVKGLTLKKQGAQIPQFLLLALMEMAITEYPPERYLSKL